VNFFGSFEARPAGSAGAIGWNWEDCEGALCLSIRCSSSAAEIRLATEGRLLTEAQRIGGGSALAMLLFWCCWSKLVLIERRPSPPSSEAGACWRGVGGTE
jgi:hypothetical protein